MPEGDALSCPECGRPAPDDARFCGNCGAGMPADGAEGGADPSPPRPPAGRRVARVTTGAALVVAISAAVAIGSQLGGDTEVVTASGHRGDGRGVTSTHGVEPGSVLWSRQRRVEIPRPHPTLRLLGGSRDTLVLAGERDLLGVHASTGALRWQLPNVDEPLFVTADRLVWVVAGHRAVSTSVDRPGAADHVTFAPPPADGTVRDVVTAMGDVLVVMDGSREQLHGIDLVDGSTRWTRTDVKGVTLEDPRTPSGRVATVEGGAIHLVGAQDGRIEATVPWDVAWQVEATSDDGLIVGIDADGERHVADVRAERVTHLQDTDPSGVVAAILRVGRDTAHLVVHAEEDVSGTTGQTYDLSTGEPRIGADRRDRIPVPVADGTAVQLARLGQHVEGRYPSGRLRWQHDLGLGRGGGPLLVDATAAGGGVVLVQTDETAILDLSTGELRWRGDLAGRTRVRNDRDAVRVGTPVRQPLLDRDGVVHDPWTSSTARVRPIDGTIEAILGGHLVGLLDGGAVSLYRGGITLRTADDEEVWRAETGFGRWDAAEIVGTHVVGVASGPSGREVALLDGATGQLLDRVEPEGARAAVPDRGGFVARGPTHLTRYVVDGDELLAAWSVSDVTRGRMHVVETDEGLLVVSAFELALRAHDDGSAAYQRVLDRPIDLPVAVNEGMVAATSSDRVVGLRLGTGEVAWTTELDDLVTTAPTIAGDAVYVGTLDGDLVWLDLATGSERGRVPTGFGHVVGAPTVADGTVYVFTDSGDELVALGADDPR